MRLGLREALSEGCEGLFSDIIVVVINGERRQMYTLVGQTTIGIMPNGPRGNP